MTIAQGSMSGIEEPRQVVIRVQAEWAALWKEHGSSDPLPMVDFTKEMVAAVFLGTRPTGGFSVQIPRARLEGNTLVIAYSEEKPSGDAIVTQVLTSPFHIVRLPRHTGATRFDRATN
jgi:hypothetical protein